MALAGCATVERPRPAEQPFAEASLGLDAATIEALRAVPRAIGHARRDDAATCEAVRITREAAPVLSRVLQDHPDADDRPALTQLVKRSAAFIADLPEQGPPGVARVDWATLAESTGTRASVIVTWGAWVDTAPWGAGPCTRPDQLTPWVKRLRAAMQIRCLDAAFHADAVARWEALSTAACWCVADAAPVTALAAAADGVPGFGPGADRIRASLATPSASPARLDPAACEN
jgi:hypothetical protein